ncbi:CAP domain-containing protein [Paraliomyxa miuraensis]|uniref:CAP domain-containing protein n=1 Tax=Paraliomyxa miuraensis TaxID=376150 RepID=UPI002254A687|nr:CAP domain-containing protein [Paraliomyxa miuraensis]MCX4242298.1 CAP domain-containing protein [Paraliomyxa miuraensis]
MQRGAKLGHRIGLASWLGWAVACGGDDEPGDDGASESGAVDGPGDDSSGGEPPAAADVPDIDYCADVAGWDEGWRAFEREVVERVNLARAHGGDCGNGGSFDATGPLAMESRLRCAARVHSLDMIQRGFFDHVNPDGLDPFDRIELAGYSFRASGENIAAGQTTPQEVVDGWLLSPGHCANILSPDYTEIGVGYVFTQTDPLGHYWTQTFGTPL